MTYSKRLSSVEVFALPALRCIFLLSESSSFSIDVVRAIGFSLFVFVSVFESLSSR